MFQLPLATVLIHPSTRRAVFAAAEAAGMPASLSDDCTHFVVDSADGLIMAVIKPDGDGRWMLNVYKGGNILAALIRKTAADAVRSFAQLVANRARDEAAARNADVDGIDPEVISDAFAVAVAAHLVPSLDDTSSKITVTTKDGGLMGVIESNGHDGRWILNSFEGANRALAKWGAGFFHVSPATAVEAFAKSVEVWARFRREEEAVAAPVILDNESLMEDARKAVYFALPSTFEVIARLEDNFGYYDLTDEDNILGEFMNLALKRHFEATGQDLRATRTHDNWKPYGAFEFYVAKAINPQGAAGPTHGLIVKVRQVMVAFVAERVAKLQAAEAKAEKAEMEKWQTTAQIVVEAKRRREEYERHVEAQAATAVPILEAAGLHMGKIAADSGSFPIDLPGGYVMVEFVRQIFGRDDFSKACTLRLRIGAKVGIEKKLGLAICHDSAAEAAYAIAEVFGVKAPVQPPVTVGPMFEIPSWDGGSIEVIPVAVPRGEATVSILPFSRRAIVAFRLACFRKTTDEMTAAMLVVQNTTHETADLAIAAIIELYDAKPVSQPMTDEEVDEVIAEAFAPLTGKAA